jgi:hypothetical protein
VLAIRDLVEHSRLGQGERALKVPIPQEPDLARVEAAEPPDVCDAAIEAPTGPGMGYRGMLADVNNLVASVKRWVRQRRDLQEPGGDLAVREAGRVELGLPDGEDRDANDILELERRIGGDVDALDGQRPIEADAPQRAVGLLAEVAAGALVQRHDHRRRTVRAETHEREAAPKVPAEHR